MNYTSVSTKHTKVSSTMSPSFPYGVHGVTRVKICFQISSLVNIPNLDSNAQVKPVLADYSYLSRLIS